MAAALLRSSPPRRSQTNVFLYDGGRILEEQNGGGTDQADYTYGGYVDQVLTMSRGGEIHYYHPNAHFNVEALTDPTGAPVERYAYESMASRR